MKLVSMAVSVALALCSTGKAADILWTQYCQHLDTMKLMVHLDADPTIPSDVEVTLHIRGDGEPWQLVGVQQMFTLTSTALFEMKGWPRRRKVAYRVTSGESCLEGVFRAEPENGQLRMVGLSCFKDIGWPWKKAIDEMIELDPDIVFFSGDQIYENDHGVPMFRPTRPEEVPRGMLNYLRKYRQFGTAFRDFLKDRPSIMITDDHDVFANDLWGKGGLTMKGDRTTGGYPCHPNWVNAVELTQTGTLPDPIDRGPHGDGILAYYTALEYGEVSFAILEDRKFKSAPSEVISQPILGAGQKSKRKPGNLEVVRDPDFDCTRLDRPDLQLLGPAQEAFLAGWSRELEESGKIGAILSQSPWAHCAMYSPTSADLDSNGWPQSGRRRALNAIGDAPVVMIHGDVHLGTLLRHGIDEWNEGPVSFSLPAFSSNASRIWAPREPGKDREPASPDYTGKFLDRFGNRITMEAAANGINGYGMIVFDTLNREVTLEFHPLNERREPSPRHVEGWPFTVRFED